MLNYFHRFIPHLARILTPILNHIAQLNKLNRKNHFTWPVECQQAFTAAKQALAKATFLNHPHEEAKLSIRCLQH